MVLYVDSGRKLRVRGKEQGHRVKTSKRARPPIERDRWDKR